MKLLHRFSPRGSYEAKMGHGQTGVDLSSLSSLATLVYLGGDSMKLESES